MRTALLISGRCARLMDCCSSVHEHIIDPYKADVFISTWTGADSHQLQEAYAPVHGLKHALVQLEIEDIEQQPFREVMEAITPPAVVWKGFDGGVASETRRNHMVYMYYKIHRANELRKEYEQRYGFRYDRVIRFRFEIIVNAFPVIEPAPNVIYIPSGHDYRGGYNDQIAMGNADVMDKYSSLYTRLIEYKDAGYPLHPESINRKHIELCGLEVNRFNADYGLVH